MKAGNIFVTGYFGAPIRGTARRIASSKGWPIYDLDAAIEAEDGRSIARICMMGGEHAYRNAEYEQVKKLCAGSTDQGGRTEEPRDPLAQANAEAGLVVLCGDGILYDEDSRALMLGQELVIAGEDQTLEELWEGARKQEGSWHAFMRFGNEEEQKAAFAAYIGRQRALFDRARQERQAAGPEAGVSG